MPPAVGQFSQDAGGRAFVELSLGFVHNGGGGSSDACDVLQKEASRTASVGNVEDSEEQAGASAFVEPGSAAGDAEVLAREARNEEIHASTQALAIEGEKVGPDRRRVQGSFFDARCQDAGGVSLPLNVADDASLDAQVSEPGSQSLAEHSNPGAQLDGMNSHMATHARETRRILGVSSFPANCAARARSAAVRGFTSTRPANSVSASMTASNEWIAPTSTAGPRFTATVLATGGFCIWSLRVQKSGLRRVLQRTLPDASKFAKSDKRQAQKNPPQRVSDGR
jgi:hypothetical protein